MPSELGFEARLSMPFDAAIDAVTEALKAEGFGVLTRIDVHDTLKKKIGADFRPYVDAHERAARLYSDRPAWGAAAIRNIAAMGYFSSDRSIREYSEKVWGLEPVQVVGKADASS